MEEICQQNTTIAHDQTQDNCNRCARRSILHPHPDVQSMDVRATERRVAINMEKNVGSLQEQALKRKERLKALRDKQLNVSDLFGGVWG